MIRVALAADAESLAELSAATPGSPRWTHAHYREMLTTASATHVVWVAEMEDAIIGFAAFSVHPPDAELETIAVHPDHQNRGYGAALLAAALQHAAGIGIAQVHLEVRTSSPAQALYRRLGFVTTGRRSRYYSKPAEDAILMRWDAARGQPTADPLSGIIVGDYGS